MDRNSALLIPNVHMRSERNSDATWHSGYLPMLGALARRLTDLGFVRPILNHEGEADAALLRVAARSSWQHGSHHGGGPPGPEGHHRRRGHRGLFAVPRGASALAQGVPCLGTSWSHKYAALFDEFGVGEYLLDTCDGDAATTALRRLASNHDKVSEVLFSRRSALETRVDAMWNRVLAIIGAKPSR